jgi:hypothetical protein
MIGSLAIYLTLVYNEPLSPNSKSNISNDNPNFESFVELAQKAIENTNKTVATQRLNAWIIAYSTPLGPDVGTSTTLYWH